MCHVALKEKIFCFQQIPQPNSNDVFRTHSTLAWFVAQNSDSESTTESSHSPEKSMKSKRRSSEKSDMSSPLSGNNPSKDKLKCSNNFTSGCKMFLLNWIDEDVFLRPALTQNNSSSNTKKRNGSIESDCAWFSFQIVNEVELYGLGFFGALTWSGSVEMES